MLIAGNELSRDEVLTRIGRIEQLGGITSFEYNDGPARGMRGMQVRTGELSFTILPDRGLDIADASFRGINLAHKTCSGEAAPTLHDPHGIGWLRTFGGGLLTTCGLTSFGPNGPDGDEDLGLHGRYSNTPARQVCDLSRWEGDEYILELTGIAEECRLFGHRLRNSRTIRTMIGSNTIELTDRIENFGSEESPLCLLYHMNLGYPLVSETSVLEVDAPPQPRDPDAAAGVDSAKTFQEPTQGFAEQVFTYDMEGTGLQPVARFANPDLGLSLSFELDPTMLPYLTEWKMMGVSDYVVGIEPGNAPVLHRSELRERGLLQHIQPGEAKLFKLKITVEMD